MTRKIARQSEVTPLNTIDHYLWNERLGVTQLPPTDPTDMSQEQSPTSSLPPQTSQAPAVDYDSSVAPSDMLGTGVSGTEQLIAPKAPMTTPASVPARSKAAGKTFDLINHLFDEHGFEGKDIHDHEYNVESHDLAHLPEDVMPFSGEIDTNHYPKTSAVSTLYGDVNPTPTTGESSGNGSQSNRNNSPDKEPGGPSSSPEAAPAAAGEEEGGAGLAASLGEDASLALLASKYKIGSALDPIVAKFKYIRHNKKTGKWEIFQKGTGKTLSTHDSKEKAESAFRAMESHMHS